MFIELTDYRSGKKELFNVRYIKAIKPSFALSDKPGTIPITKVYFMYGEFEATESYDAILKQLRSVELVVNVRKY